MVDVKSGSIRIRSVQQESETEKGLRGTKTPEMGALDTCHPDPYHGGKGMGIFRDPYHKPPPEAVHMPTKYLILIVLVLGVLCPPSAGRAQTPEAFPDTASIQPEPKTPAEQKAELQARVKADPADGKAWNDLGVLSATEGDFATARDCFISAVQTDPTDGDYHRNLGLAFSHLGADEMAIREFQAYRKFDKMGGRDYWRLIGDAQKRAGMTGKAMATYREGIETLGPKVSPELMRLVLSLLETLDSAGNEQSRRDLLNEYAPQAAKWLETHEAQTEDGWLEANNLVHNRVTMLVDDAQLMEKSGLASEATAMYEQAYELAPDRLDLLPRLVDAYLADGRDLDARVATRLARERYPDKPGTWIASGKVYEKTGHLEDAVTAYEKAYGLDDSLDDVRVAIGNLLMRLGRDTEATKYLRAGVNTANANPEVVYNYAVSLMREKKFHAAIPSLRVVVKEKPEMAQAWLALAQCYQNIRQYRDAMSCYQRAYALNPDPKLIFQAGSCAQRAEIPEKAIACYQEALRADSTYVKAQYNLSLAYMDAGQYGDAAASFTRLMAMEGPTYRAYYSQGLAYYFLKDYEDALVAFEKGMDIEETPVLLNAIGRVYAAKGNKKEAMVWYDQAKKLKEGS